MPVENILFAAGGGALFGAVESFIDIHNAEYMMPKGVYIRPHVYRECLACSRHSIFVDGKDLVEWYVNRNDYGHEVNALCKKCNTNIIYNPIHSPQNREKRITFHERRVYTKGPLRTGRCMHCHSDKKRTLMHHIEYDEENPEHHVIEMCFSCHSVLHQQERRRKRLDARAVWRCYACNGSYSGTRDILNPPTELFVCRNCAWRLSISSQGRRYHYDN